MFGEDLIQQISFYAGLIPSVWMAILFGYTSPWWRSREGRSIFFLVLAIALTYLSSVLVLTWPEIFLVGGRGYAYRLSVRFGVAAVLFYLLFAFLRSRRASKREEEDGEEDESQ